MDKDIAITGKEIETLLYSAHILGNRTNTHLGVMQSLNQVQTALREIFDSLEESFDDFPDPDDADADDERMRLRALCFALDLLRLIDARKGGR